MRKLLRVIFTTVVIMLFYFEFVTYSFGYSEKEYGVRWKIISDNVSPDKEMQEYENSICERVGDSVGFSVCPASPQNEGMSDFDKVYPWSDIKLCVLEIKNNVVKKSYLSADDTIPLNKDIFVEIPKHYIKREIKDGYEYRWISAEKKDGYEIDPSFVENGKELPFIYVSAYEGSVKNGILNSYSGVYPTTEFNRSEFRQMARKKARGFAIFDIRTLMTIQNLFLVEFANKNSQAALGNGWSWAMQPYEVKTEVSEKNTNRIIISGEIPSRLFIGCPIMICKDNESRVRERVLVDIVTNFPETGKHSLYFSGDPVDIESGMVIGNGPQYAGYSNIIKYHSGRTENISTNTGIHSPYLCVVKYRGMENLYGNVWHYIDGINIRNGETFFCKDIENYVDGIDENYIKVEYTQAIQNSNAGVGTSTEINFVKNLGYSSSHPWLALPSSYAFSSIKSSSEIKGYENWPYASGRLRDIHFGDYYYYSKSADIYVHGGGWDHYWRCGLFTMRGWRNYKSFWYLEGTRLIYKPVDYDPVSIVEQPQDIISYTGIQAILKVSTKGDNVSYQWQKLVNDEWVDIANATSSTYEISSTMLSDNGEYRCVVSNGGATVISKTATLTVRESASITIPPQKTESYTGYYTTLSVSANGYEVKYQWQKLEDGEWVDIEGATMSTLNISNLKLTDNGEYRCVVSNGGGSVVSETSKLTVLKTSKIKITQQPVPIPTAVDEDTELSVSASGGGIYYQWQVKNGKVWEDVSGATSSTLAFKNLQAEDNNKEYRCILKNDISTATSKTAKLVV
ncbi:MAG: immunoglobulin domain-containing protein, partial [Verrucomicrobiaceae bacterium]|nr:immunoglobulin domain-containing protein [Verrucomicrobiaceae bacterium]